jgi:putative sterol carrier protein
MNNKAVFPTQEWMAASKDKFNTDEQYAQIARNWEGDLRVILESDSSLSKTTWLYWDLWHGTCRDAFVEDPAFERTPALVITAPYTNFVKILSGEVGVMQALMGRKVSVHGSMLLIMRNVPTVIDFVRCCQEITQTWI